MFRSLLLTAALLAGAQSAAAQAPKTWTQVGMLTCKLNPSITAAPCRTLGGFLA